MSTTKKYSLPRIIKFMVDLIYGLLLFVIVGLVIWMAITPFMVNRMNIFGTASVPVIVGRGDDPRLEIIFESEPGLIINNAQVENAKGTLTLETASPPLILIANGAKLVVAIGLAYIFYLLRTVMKSILSGDPFADQNRKYIQRLGWAVLGVGFGGSILEGIAAWEILRLLPATQPILAATTTFDSRLILGTALFIFLLAQIWGYGIELERDRALTV
jgi:hypothetical protein